jgi:hypothetical protein
MRNDALDGDRTISKNGNGGAIAFADLPVG